MKKADAKEHYDLLVREGNDPVKDPPVLRDYMDRWDGPPFLAALGLSPERTVLEIGVGTGRLARQVLEIGCAQFTGIDISPLSIKRARENLHVWEGAALIADDYLRHAFHQTFDIIYCSLTLFHFRDKQAFIHKTAGLLAPAGRIVLSVPQKAETSIRYGDREVPLYPDDPDVLKTLLLREGLILRAGFVTEFAHILVAEKV